MAGGDTRRRVGLLRAVSWAIAALPAGSGRGMVARKLYEHGLGEADAEVVAKMRGGGRFRLDLTDRTQAQVFLTREYEPPLSRFIARRLANGGVFLDVGAHVGLISISVAAAARSSRVHAFEPDPTNAESFRANASLNAEFVVTLNQVAVGAVPGTAMLERSVPGGDRALGRIVPGAEASHGRTVEVPMVSVDSYLASRQLERVDVLKIDVEGLEPAVLLGARSALGERRIGCIVCEINESALARNQWSSETIRTLLGEHGYQQTPIPEVGLRRLFPRSGLQVEDAAFVPGVDAVRPDRAAAR